MAAKRKKKPARAGRPRRVWVKAHCRKRPVAAWRKREAVNRDMPF